MTQIEFRAGRFGGRLFKSAASSALALSALAGGVMLSGGDAKAACNDSMLPGPVDCLILDPVKGTFTDRATVTSVAGLPPANTEVNFQQTGLFYPSSQVQIDTDFNPALTGVQRTSEYTVEKLTPGFWFDQVDLTWNQVPGGNAAVSAKYEFFDRNAPTVALAADPIILTNSGSVADIVGNNPTFDPTKVTLVKVTNTYTPNNGAIDNVENTFRNVPGPLPILGAGAAFGFSRKLRGRIKAARTA
jgi:hypothetical protein